MSVAIMTDSNSGLSLSEAAQYGIYAVPMPIYINGEKFYEDISITRDEFFLKLKEGADVKTSQPEPGSVTDMWDDLLTKHDEIVYAPMSSGLSGACATARMLAEDYGDKVVVVNNHRISVPLVQALLDAKKMADDGMSAKEIGRILEETKDDNSIYITVDTLKYLKQGGRITPLGAAIGTVLNIKPVLQICGEKLDAYSKARGIKQAKEIMIEALRRDMREKFAGIDPVNGLWLEAAHTVDDETAAQWKSELEAAFPGMQCRIAPLGLSIACHTGEGAIACGLTKRMFN